VRERYFNYFLIADQHTLVMNRRNDKDIWANMYDLPLIETTALLTPEELLLLPQLTELFGDNVKIEQLFPVVKHLLTHQRLFVRFIILHKQYIQLKEEWFITDVNNLNSLALPNVIFIFLKNIFNL
jgi:A/G-specific adenine glycosylase